VRSDPPLTAWSIGNEIISHKFLEKTFFSITPKQRSLFEQVAQFICDVKQSQSLSNSATSKKMSNEGVGMAILSTDVDI
jgi:hypothetical protein